MEHEQRLAELEHTVGQLSRSDKRRGWRSRWAAVGAAVAVTFGGGTVLHYAMAAPGDVAPNSFIPISPTRILDTRPAPLNVGGFVGPLTSGQTYTFQVTGVAGVPANAAAVVMNVTVDATSFSSFLTVFPAGETRPTVSNLNWKAGTTIPNLVTVKIGAAGQVTVFNLNGNVHVIADVAGYYVPGNDKFIALDILGHVSDTATFGPAFGPGAGLNFRDSASDAASFHFVLPPDYTPGGAIVGSLTWHTAVISCNVSWRANFASVSRTGQVHITGLSAAAGVTNPTPGTSSATANTVQTATFTLTSPSASSTLQPGDSYTFGLFRDGFAGADTCAGNAQIDSLVVRYD
jgi:hypothetical protein